MKCQKCKEEMFLIEEQFIHHGRQEIFTDKNGKQHCHDPNRMRKIYKCENGHLTAEDEKIYECWCEKVKPVLPNKPTELRSGVATDSFGNIGTGSGIYTSNWANGKQKSEYPESSG